GGSSTQIYRRLTDRAEFVDAATAVLVHIDVALGVHGHAMRLVELAGETSRTAEAADLLAGLALDDIDLGVVLVDDKHQPLLRIGREAHDHRRAAALLRRRAIRRR